MIKQKPITALPSTVKYSAGLDVLLSDLKGKERSRVQRGMCRNAGRKLSDYYSNNLTEWKTFVNIMADSE